MFKINTAETTTTAHDLENNPTTRKPKFIKTLALAQIDKKKAMAEAYAVAFEEADRADSFIAELDINKAGLSTEHQAQAEILKNMIEESIAEQEKTFLQTLNDFKDIGQEVLSTEWTNDRGNMTIRTKFIFDPKQGIIVKELKEQPSKETYTVAIPSIRGLASMRAELEKTSTPELEELHNNHCLLTVEVEPETEIFFSLAEIDEDDTSTKIYKNGGVFILYKKGLIVYASNDKQAKTTEKPRAKRDF